MPDFSVKVTADTKEAEVKLRQVDESADKATKPRSLKVDVKAVGDGLGKLADEFSKLDDHVVNAYNNIKKTYQVIEKMPVIGAPLQEFRSLVDTTKDAAVGLGTTAVAMKENGGAATILGGSLRISVTAADDLVSRLSRLGMAMFAVKEAAGMLRGAFGGMFDATLGREARFRETVLKMQTTLASSKAAIEVGGQQLTDPYERVVGVQKQIEARVDSIRQRSLELAGVTSEQVVETFGIVVGQVGQIGGSLKDAEDLAISFAAALGTFGIPLEQARQEVNSMLMGDITMDSYLAKALGITNADIARAKTQAGGVVEYLQTKLASAVAGQAISAKMLAGVTSNIQEVIEMVQKAFGAATLDGFNAGLTKIYELVVSIRPELEAMATTLGGGIGKVFSETFTQLSGAGSGSMFAGMVSNMLTSVTQGMAQLMQQIQAALQPLIGTIQQVLGGISIAVSEVVAGLAKLAQGLISLQISNITALINAFSTLVPALVSVASMLRQVLTVYGQFLQLPGVQYLNNLVVQWQLLGKTGVWAGMALISTAASIVTGWKGVSDFFVALFMRIRAGFASLITSISAFIQSAVALFTSLIASVNRFFSMFGIGTAETRVNMKMLTAQTVEMGVAMDGLAVKARNAGGAMAGIGGAMKNGIVGMVAGMAQLFALQLVITGLIDMYGRYQQALEEQKSSKNAAAVMKQYGDSVYLTTEQVEKLTAAEKRQAEQRKALVEGEVAAAQERAKKNGKEVADFDKKRAELLEGKSIIDSAPKAVQDMLNSTGFAGSIVRSSVRGWELLFNMAGEAEIETKRKTLAADQKLIDAAEARRKAAQDLIDKEADIAAAREKARKQLDEERRAMEQIVALSKEYARNSTAQNSLDLSAKILSGNLSVADQAIERAKNAKIAAKSELEQNDLELYYKNRDWNVTMEYESKQPGLYKKEDIDKLRIEIAALENRGIELKTTINNEAFNQLTAEFAKFKKEQDAAVAQRNSALAIEANTIRNTLSITQARAAAETALNNTALAGLKTKLEQAKTEYERRDTIERIYDLEIANARIALLSTREQISANLELSRIELSKAQLTENDLQVQIRKGLYLKQDVTELRNALRLQQDSVRIASDNLNTTVAIAKEQYRGADATFKAAEAAAKLARENAIAADNAGRYATNMQQGAAAASRAASASSGGGSSAANVLSLGGKTWKGGSNGVIRAIQGAPPEVNEALRKATSREANYMGDTYTVNAKMAAATQEIARAYFADKKRQEDLAKEIQSSGERESAVSQIKGLLEKGLPDIARKVAFAYNASAKGILDRILIVNDQIQPTTSELLAAKAKPAQLGAPTASPESALNSISSKQANQQPPMGAPTINLTTGPVYTFNGAEYLTVEDFNKAISDYNDQFWSEFRKQNSLRLEQALAWQ